MPCLTMKLFGAPRLELDGVALVLDYRKAMALLAYLAVTRQIHTRDALATLFWPEYAEARTYLRNNLWSLRKTLGVFADTWLDVERETVGFKADAPVWLDVTEFYRQFAACRTHGHADTEVCARCLPCLHEAITLYTDDFLAGFTLRDSPAFDEWQIFQREQLRQAVTVALDKLVQHYSKRGEFDLAITQARRWLALEPAHEPVHCHLMQLYAWSGQQAAALRQYQACTRSLAAELAVTPTPETVALYQQIRKGRPTVRTSEGDSETRHNLYSQAALLQGDVDKAEMLAQESLTLACTLGGDHLIAAAELSLARIAIARGDSSQTVTWLQNSSKVWAAVSDWHASVNVLDAFAALAVAQKQPVRALRLAGAVTALRRADKEVLPPVLQAHFDQIVAAARTMLGENDAITAWKAGQAMGLAKAVAYALNV